MQLRKLESDAEGRCGDGHSRRAILHRHDDCVASIRKSGPEIENRCTLEGVNRQKNASIRKSGLEIKNRCTQEGVNGENPASIRKSDPEIKNRCTQEGLNRENPASTLVRQWRQKRVLMRPEAAFPYVFAAEGAQHPPNKPPRSTTRRNKPTATNPPQQPASTNPPQQKGRGQGLGKRRRICIFAGESAR